VEKTEVTIVIILCILFVNCFLPFGINTVSAQTPSPLQYPENWCLNFDGLNDWVAVEASSLFQLDTLTLEAWIRPKLTIMPGSDGDYGHTNGSIICRRPEVLTSGFWFAFAYSQGCLEFVFRSGSYNYSHHTDRSIWYNTTCYHIAVTYNRTLPRDNLKFYVNGTLDSIHNITDPITYADNQVWIGGMMRGNAFGGTIDEVRMWNVSRTQQQIQTTMPRILNETETADPNLIAYWRFDEGSGGIAQDSSIYGNPAILIGAPATPTWTQQCCPIIPELPFTLLEMIVLVVVSSGTVLLSHRKLKN